MYEARVNNDSINIKAWQWIKEFICYNVSKLKALAQNLEF